MIEIIRCYRFKQILKLEIGIAKNLSLDIQNDLPKIILYVEFIIFLLLIYYLLFIGESKNR